jgi:hypothetical protein
MPAVHEGGGAWLLPSGNARWHDDPTMNTRTQMCTLRHKTMLDPDAVDYEELKRQLRIAIRAAIQERANELDLSYEECVDRCLRGERRPM